jgi:hypothetical protein
LPAGTSDDVMKSMICWVVGRLCVLVFGIIRR